MSTPGTLATNQSLNSGEALTSPAGNAQLVMETDGNLVLYALPGNIKLWESNTKGQGGTTLTLQSSGNLVITNSSGATIWQTNTNATHATNAQLMVREDQNVVIFDSYSASSIWETFTTNYSHGVPNALLNVAVYIWNDEGSTQFMSSHATQYDGTPGSENGFTIAQAPNGYYIQNNANGKYLSNHATELKDTAGLDEEIKLQYNEIRDGWSMQNVANGEYYGRKASSLNSSPDTVWYIKTISEYNNPTPKTNGIRYVNTLT